MQRIRNHLGVQLVTTILTGMVFTEVYAKRLELDTKSASQKRESLIWNVNHQVTKIQIDILGGRPIVNSVNILGDREFKVGSYLENGQNWSHELDADTRVGKIRVNVDQAEGSQVRLVVWTGGSANVITGAAGSGGDAAAKRPTGKRESLLWEVHDSIRGFEVSVTKGRPIINTVKLVGGEEFTVGAYVEEGKSFRKDFDSPVQVSQIRINVDKAIGSELKLISHK